MVGRTGKRVSVRDVQRRIKRRAAAAGIDADVHPHMLRHSFASHLLQSSGDLRAVQEMLGHASIASTQVYTHLDFQHLAKVYDAAHPRARRAQGEEGPDAAIGAERHHAGHGAHRLPRQRQDHASLNRRGSPMRVSQAIRR